MTAPGGMIYAQVPNTFRVDGVAARKAIAEIAKQPDVERIAFSEAVRPDEGSNSRGMHAIIIFKRITPRY
jgi:hypothetical protein